MSAHNFHAHDNHIILDRRDGPDVERSTFDIAGAERLRDELDAAIAQAKKRQG